MKALKLVSHWTKDNIEMHSVIVLIIVIEQFNEIDRCFRSAMP